VRLVGLGAGTVGVAAALVLTGSLPIHDLVPAPESPAHEAL